MNGQENDNLEFELSQYLDGQLTGRQARRLERRLEQDPALRATLQQYAALDGQLASLARAELAGAGYDFQRAEVLRRLERQALLARPRPRFLLLRRFFALPAGGALAVAAAILIAVLVWRTGQPPTAIPAPGPGAAEVSVAILAPAAQHNVEAQVSLRRLEDREIRLPEDAPDSETPSGTVMVSFNPPPPEEWGAGAYPFTVE